MFYYSGKSIILNKIPLKTKIDYIDHIKALFQNTIIGNSITNNMEEAVCYIEDINKKIDNVNVDVKVVKESIFNILNQNHIKHSKRIA